MVTDFVLSFWMTGQFHFLTSAGLLLPCYCHCPVGDTFRSNLVPDPVAGAVVEGCTNSWSEVGLSLSSGLTAVPTLLAGGKTYFHGQVCAVSEKFQKGLVVLLRVTQKKS